MTEEAARDRCTNTVNNHSGVQQCSQMMQDDFSEMIDDCVDDIGVSLLININNIIS